MHVLLTTYFVIIQKTMPPRKLEEDVMIKFCKSLEGVCEATSLAKILQSCHIFGINCRSFRKMPINKNNE